jgi:hypothetical protein
MSGGYFGERVQPFVHVTRTTNQTAPAGALSIVQMNNVVEDLNGFYDPATYRVRPTIPGLYLVIAGVSALSAASGEAPATVISKNGGYDVEGPVLGTLAASNVTALNPAVQLVRMNGSTDYLQAMVYLPPGVTTVLGVGIRTYLKVTRLGP